MQRHKVEALNSNVYGDVEDLDLASSREAIFSLPLSPSSPDEARTLLAAVSGTHDGRDKLLLEMAPGSFLLFWAEEFIVGDGGIRLIRTGDLVSVGDQTGRVVARFDHNAPTPSPGWRGWAEDAWEHFRFTPPPMLPSPLLGRLGVSFAAMRKLAPPCVAAGSTCFPGTDVCCDGTCATAIPQSEFGTCIKGSSGGG